MLTEIAISKEERIGEIMKKARAVKMIMKQRNRIGLSSFSAAEKAGINQSTWSRTERGERDTSWEVLLMMARAVGLETNITIKRKD